MRKVVLSVVTSGAFVMSGIGVEYSKASADMFHHVRRNAPLKKDLSIDGNNNHDILPAYTYQYWSSRGYSDEEIDRYNQERRNRLKD